MHTVRQASHSVNQNFPQGQSHFRPGPKHPYLIACEYQFADASDGRKWRRRRAQKRELCRAVVLIGADRTAAEYAKFLGWSARTVEDIIRLCLEQGFLSNVRILAARDNNGRRIFKRERMLRRLNPQALLPANPAVCLRESCGHTSPKNLESTQDRFDTDSPTAKNAVRPRVHPSRRPKPYSKPPVQERPDRFIPRELLLRFTKEFNYSLEDADGRLGWIVKRTEARKKYRNKLGPVVRHVWKYICAANRSIDARTDDPNELGWLIEAYSFADMFKLDLSDSYFDSLD